MFEKKIVKKKKEKKTCKKTNSVQKICPTSWKIGFWEKKKPLIKQKNP